MRRLAATLLVLALSSTACVAPGASVGEPGSTVGLQDPTFDPLPSATPEPTVTASADLTPGRASPSAGSPEPTQDGPTAAVTSESEPAPTSSAIREPEPEPTSPRPAPVTGTLVDGTGDLRGLEAGRAPGHADLREVVLTMGPDRGRITIAFAEAAPEAGDDDEILNVATYHDVTGDGRVDYEIWASMTANGWGTSWFDLREGTARYAADDEVEVEVVDGTVVLTFPPSHLDGARSGQWLASSEWGSALTISSGTSATDDAPDDRSGVAWPA